MEPNNTEPCLREWYQMRRHCQGPKSGDVLPGGCLNNGINFYRLSHDAYTLALSQLGRYIMGALKSASILSSFRSLSKFGGYTVTWTNCSTMWFDASAGSPGYPASNSRFILFSATVTLTNSLLYRMRRLLEREI
jgi:hypothetical protein